jgi:prepilin-type N-terminal cleavage/methylation domain-containing protein
MKNSRNIDRHGFTLIEVMLTLMIMAGIMVTITKILTAARKSRDEIHNIQERQLAGPAIMHRLERDLRSIFSFNRDPRFALRIRDRVSQGFDADTIDFVATTDSLMPYRENAAEPFRRADINEVGYRLRPRPDSDDFLELYRREDFGVDDAPFDDGRFHLLHDRVKGFNIEVYEEDGPEAEPIDSWGTDDDEFIGFPARIDIELTIELAPRLVREQLVLDRRTMSYKRVIRFPEVLRLAMNIQALPTVPVIEPPTAENTAGGAGGEDPEALGDATTSTTGGGDRGGGDGAGGGGGDDPFDRDDSRGDGNDNPFDG